MPASDGLTPKQELFCNEYLKDMNGTQAAIRAGYSVDSARSTASEILTKPDIIARIVELNEKRFKNMQADVESVIRELLWIAGVDVAGAFDHETGALLPLKKIPMEIRRTICSVEVDELWEGYGKERTQIGVTKKVKFWDKNKALEMLGRHLKMFTDKHEHSGTVRLEDIVAGKDTSKPEPGA